MMESIEIDLKEQYVKMANAYSKQKSLQEKREDNRKDIDLLMEVLGHHTVSKSASEETTCEFIIFDHKDRNIIINKLLSKIELL